MVNVGTYTVRPNKISRGPKWGPFGGACDRLFLHCSKLRLYDLRGHFFTVTAPLPPELQDFLQRLRKKKKEHMIPLKTNGRNPRNIFSNNDLWYLPLSWKGRNIDPSHVCVFLGGFHPFVFSVATTRWWVCVDPAGPEGSDPRYIPNRRVKRGQLLYTSIIISYMVVNHIVYVGKNVVLIMSNDDIYLYCGVMIFLLFCKW